MHCTNLMHVVMRVFTTDDRVGRLGMGCFALDAGVVEAQSLLLETCLECLILTVMVLAVLHGNDVVRMLLWLYHTVLHWLNSGVIVILMHLAVDCSSCFIMTMFLDGLLRHGGGNRF